MSLEKKKLIPKLKKSLKNFLTDESGKITKKDALGLSAGAAIFAGVDSIYADTTVFRSYTPDSQTSCYTPLPINPPVTAP